MSTLSQRINEMITSDNLSVGLIAEMAGVSSSAVSQWLSKATGTMSGESALNLQRRAGYNAEWLLKGRLPKKLDSQGSPPTKEGLAGLSAPPHPFTSGKTKRVRIPLLTWERAHEVGKDNQMFADHQCLPIDCLAEPSISAKLIEVPDDVLAPYLRMGDLILVDPAAAPMRDCVALMRSTDGAFLLRFWVPLANGGFEAHSTDGTPLDSERHGLVAIGPVLQRITGPIRRR